ncbi:hypothetical protein K7X08_036790 [Anisodus acutangulus]|uniref:Uncharacterized protein n=1 Tax=Anisodus acutangulus TaxID=402998 RepID=A0A9Q1L7U7_9SOLA|nr:hypothetical protein K7X08_036790 [Anisodus acutangulus]
MPKSTRVLDLSEFKLTPLKLKCGCQGEILYQFSCSWTPSLLDIDIMQCKRVLRLDDIRGNVNAWMGLNNSL